MKKNIKLIIFWILFYVPFVAATMFGIYYVVIKYSKNLQSVELRKHIGEKIDFGTLLDLNNNKVKLICKTDITLIDFWYKGCIPCLKEMEKFTPLISGKENKITDISISKDDKENWKPLF